MSSKKFVYLLMMVSIVCGFIVGDTAYGQSTGSLSFKGTVMEAEGTPAPGYAISGETVPANPAFIFVGVTSRTDGSYNLTAFSTAGAKINVGDQVKITATDAEGNDISVIYTVTAEDIVDNAGNVDLNIILSGLTVEVDPGELPADGKSTSTITVTVQEGGAGLTGDTISVSVDRGTVDATAIEVGNGVYIATYTAPSSLPLIPIVQISVSSATTGDSVSAAILLKPVPTTVAVDVSPSVFSADTPSTGAVTVSVERVGPVTNETVTLMLNPAVGSVSAVTNNGDGTYSATYTSGSTAGNVTLTATATGAGVSDSASIAINAGPPAAIALSAAPMTVTSLGSATVTAMVSDSGGNGVGGLTLTATTSGTGTLTPFIPTPVFGTYVATYSAPMVEAEGTETLTVSTDGISADLTLDLTPEPPIDVNIITVEGTVYKVDGDVPADDVKVTVTIGSNSPEMRVTDTDGSYEVTLVNPLGVAATTGDIVSVVVTDDAGMERGREEFPLVNDILEDVLDGMSVVVNVTTDIVIPPRSVNVLEVMGMVYKVDGSTSAGGGLDVVVTRGSRTQTVQTGTDGSYSASFVELLSSVATSIDNSLSVVVSDGSGPRGRNDDPLLNTELGTTGSASVTRDVTSDIGLTSNVLAVLGTVYLKNGDSEHVPARSHLREGELTVTVTNTTRNWMESTTVDNDGEYDISKVNPIAAVAETGDVLTVDVMNAAGVSVGSATHTLTIEDLQTARVDINIMSDTPAEVRLFSIEGTVVNLDGSAAEPGLAVMIRLDGMVVEEPVTTDAAGGYYHDFVDLTMPVAATGDVLMIDVLRADDFHGHAIVELRSDQLAYLNQPLMIDPITLRPPRLELGGLSINTHYTGIQDPVIQQLLGMDLAGLAAAGADMGDSMGGTPLVALPPSPFLLISPLLSAIGALEIELPMGFDLGDENIVQESFGNAITTRPTAWATLPADARHPGRWLNGDQLNLYVVGSPTITDVTFTLNGALSATADSVPAGGSFPYTFQLEEELIALFLGGMPTFGAVQLMVDGEAPVDMVRSDTGVWSGQASLTPGSTVSYYYMVHLFKPYHDPLAGLTVSSFPLIDPRNRQVKTSGFSQALEGLLSSELRALDPGVRSVFSVPAVDHQQSLWVGRFDLATSADGEYTLDVAVNYRGGYAESINDKMFTLDQTPPTADIALNLGAPGMNVGMYMRDDGTYVATGPMPGESSLTVSAIPSPTSEAASYMYQLAALDDGGYPGAWNPAVTADLLPLDLVTLLTDPGSILPLTYGPPHQIEMLIRNSQGGALIGRYGLRAVGIDSLLNMDSARMPGVVVDLVPPDPDVAMVSAVQSDFDGNGVIEGLEMQYTAGDVVVFSDSIAMLVVDMVERTDHPLTSIALEFQVPGGGWQPIGMFTGDQLATIMMGDQLSVTLPVPDIPVLPDRGGHVMVRTVTTNALNVVNEEVFSAAYQRRTAPEVSGIYTSVTDRHPDSGGPQGMITISAFTQAVTAPNTAAVQLEVRRSADTDWMPLDSVQIADTTVTSHVEIAIIEDLVNSILSGSPTASISPLYRKWSLTVDSAVLEDTILDDTPAASDASLDDNPYVARAVAIDMAGTTYPSADGITDSISLDNYSPTAITTVDNEIEMVVPREDGSYYVSGLLHESVPDPMLTLTSRTGAHSSAFTGGIALAVNDASGTAMEIPATGLGDSGNYTFTGVFNLSSIPNGTYTFMAVAHAADGSPEDRIVAMAITVEVGNFTPPDNFADPSVDILSVTNTLGEANSPSEINAMYPTGFPAIDDKVTATLIVPNVSTGDLDVLIGADGMSAAMMGALMVMEPDANNNIVIMIDTSGLGDGMYGLIGTVTKPNGSVPFGLPSIGADRTGPAVEIVSPLSRHQVTTLPTIQVNYTDASGLDPNETDPMPVVISLTSLVDNETIDVNENLIRMTAVADGEVLARSGDIVYTHDDPLIGGAYRVEVTVTDVLGNEATAEPVEFTVEGVQPTVTIVSPLAGQIVDPRQPLIITAALTGNGEIEVTEFQVNEIDVKWTLEDNNWLTHTMQPLGEAGSMLQRGSNNTISVEIRDAEGRTAAGSATFAVSLDDTPPAISGPSPKGDITRPIGRITALVTDNESNITRVQYALDDEPLKDISFADGRVVEVGGGKEVKGQTTFNLFDAPLGTHTVTVVAESTGGSATLTWEFTIIAPDTTPPQIVTYSPLGIIRTDRPVLAATVSDESGFKKDGITLILAGVPGNQGSGRRSSPTSTTVTFTPSIAVTPGPYTARITVIDRHNNRTEAEWQFTVELDETPPSITTSSPHGIIRSDKPIVSVSASDDRSGVDSIEIAVKDDGNNLSVNGTTSVRSDKTAATFTPTQPLHEGTYTVDVKVMDVAGNQAASKWQFTVELDTIPPTVLSTRPSQEHTEHRRPIISATYTDNLSGIDVDSVKLTLDGTTIEPDEVSETQVIFTPKFDLTFDIHTVTLEVSDTAPTPNTATQEWSFYVERIGLADARNYPNPFEDGTTIGFRLSRQAKVTIRIYDFTGRIVAQPITNSLREAGPVEIAWSGDTSAGEHLARGVYFCHILMESELEPQSAILKMAIVSE